jgi:hypothetical protein
MHQGDGAYAAGATAAQPPTYFTRAIVLAVVLVPLGLLFGLSSLYTAYLAFFGPPVMSEVPGAFRGFMQLVRALVGLFGVFVSLAAVVQASKVSRLAASGDFNGATTASKNASGLTKQALLNLAAILLLMGLDMLDYLSAD